MNHKEDKIKLSCILLAAGRSRRFGPPNKLLENIGCKSILNLSCAVLGYFNFTEKVIVLGYESEKMQHEIPQSFKTVLNPDYRTGMASSIKSGVAGLGSAWDGVLIYLADMPFIHKDSINLLIDNFIQAQGRKICVPIYNEQTGNPVIFPVKFKEKLMDLKGDTGARNMIRNCFNDAILVQVDDKNILFDIDTKSNLQNFRGKEVQ